MRPAAGGPGGRGVTGQVGATTIEQDKGAGRAGTAPAVGTDSMATHTTVDQMQGREVEQPGLGSQTLAFTVDLGIFAGLAAVFEIPLGGLGQRLSFPVFFVLPFFWRRWHRSPGMALRCLYVYRADDPERPIGLWRAFFRFYGSLIALMAVLLFLMPTLLVIVDLAKLHGVNPVDRALGLRVVRYKNPPSSDRPSGARARPRCRLRRCATDGIGARNLAA